MLSADNKTAVQSPEEQVKIFAAVIDDAFDSIQVGEVRIDELKAVFQEVDADPTLSRLFDELGIERPDLDEVNEDHFIDFVNQLWSQMDSDTQLVSLLSNTVFLNRMTKKEQLESVCRNIENCGIVLSKYGEVDIESSIEEFAGRGYQLVFIDYYLSALDGNEGKDRAVKVAHLIDDRLRDDKPVTVLMSSHPDAQSQKTEFRKNANLREAAFQFVPKSVLSDSDVAGLCVKGITSSLRHTKRVQQYILRLSEAADLAVRKFQEEIRDLTIDDYAFIQHAKLNKDKHPLGDYMNWLYESRWGSLLFSNEAFRNEQRELDKMQTGPGLLIRDMPSLHIADMYASALFDDHVELLGPNPQLETTAGSSIRYYLHTGDIFSNSVDKDIWIVVNPQCDLERLVPDDRSILLIPGVLSDLNQPSEKETGTNFFRLGSKSFKVAWKLKQVKSIPFSQLHEWIVSENLERNHRLKLPFALKIQQEFTASITRVGTPVSPPIAEQVEMELWGVDPPNNVLRKLTVQAEKAVRSLIRTGSKEYLGVTLTSDSATRFKKLFIEYLKEINSLKLAAPSNSSLSKDVSRLTTFINEFDDWFENSHPFADKKYANNIIQIVSNWPGSENTKIDTLLLLNVKTESLKTSDDSRPLIPILTQESDATHP